MLILTLGVNQEVLGKLLEPQGMKLGTRIDCLQQEFWDGKVMIPHRK